MARRRVCHRNWRGHGQDVVASANQKSLPCFEFWLSHEQQRGLRVGLEQLASSRRGGCIVFWTMHILYIPSINVKDRSVTDRCVWKPENRTQIQKLELCQYMSIMNYMYGKTAKNILHSSVFIGIYFRHIYMALFFFKKEKSLYIGLSFHPDAKLVFRPLKTAALGKLLPARKVLSCLHAWRKLASLGLSCLPCVVCCVRHMFAHLEVTKGRCAIVRRC